MALPRAPLAVLLLLHALGAAAQSPGLTAFSPEGRVKGVRQAVAQFLTPMVPVGDPALADPYVADCPVPGRGRWADPRTWLYDFERDLPAGLACRFTPRPGLADLEGRPVDAPARAFDTGGPQVIASIPGEGELGIDENQVFLLAFDAPPDPASLAAQARCLVEGLAEALPLRVLDAVQRKAVLAARRAAGQRDDFLYQRPDRRGRPGAAERAEAEPRIAALACARPLPAGARLRLALGAGLSTPGGVATSEPQHLAFQVRPAFTVRLECERARRDAACLPMRPINVQFSAPVARALAESVSLRDASGRLWPVKLEKGATLEGVSFPGPFPEQGRFSLALPAGFRDDAGRPAQNAARFPLAVATDEYPPLAKFAAPFGVVELEPGPPGSPGLGVLPVTLRNLETAVPGKQLSPGRDGIPGRSRRLIDDEAAIIDWLARVRKAANGRWERDEASGESRNLTGADSIFAPGEPAQRFTVPKARGSKAFEVVGIPLKGAGLHVVEIASPRLGAALLGEPRPYHAAAAALVTNMAVHLKWGAEGSVVAVTTLDRARPVPRAKVTVRDCGGALLWEGDSGREGIARIPAGKLPEPYRARWCQAQGGGIWAFARAGDDLSFVHSDWASGISPWDFGLAGVPRLGDRAAHTVLDRTLLRAGETVHMKHFLRRPTGAGLSGPGAPLPDRLQITHQGSGESRDFPLDLSSGSATGEWRIPPEARLGVYEIAYAGKNQIHSAGSFRVEEFRLPVMKAGIQPPAAPLVRPKEAPLDLNVAFIAGGGAGRLPVRLTTLTRPREPAFPEYRDWSFRSDTLKEGVSRQAGYDEEEEPEAGEAPRLETPARQTPLTLDPAGTARALVDRLPPVDRPATLVAELEYPDANGQTLAVARDIDLWPAHLVLGLKTENWVGSREALRFQVLVLDLKGKPLAGRPLKVDLWKREFFGHRKRLVGGFYAYESAVESRRQGEVCAGRSDARGILQCQVSPKHSGEVVLEARALDDLGNEARATTGAWVLGEEDWGFDGGSGDRMDLIPERRALEPGEKARVQVRMPFRDALALVTVEREGVLDAWLTRLSGRDPVVEVPLKPAYAPNVFVSVLALRGRVASPKPTALLDLARPAFRMGLTELQVGWTPHRLDVRVTPERDSYPVRGEARVKVKVARADGGALPAGAEFAFAAVDEALLELAPNESWKLLDAMMQSRNLKVRSATAQMQVVGKRHYGRKALPHGGGGGRQNARELFDTLLLWKGSVKLDQAGEASLAVPLNDSLTRFRLAAVASAGTGLFGLGEARVATRQDLALLAALPPSLREGDRLRAGFTVRNASARPMEVALEPRASAAGTALPGVGPVDLKLAPGEAREVTWELAVPAGATALAWDVEAKEKNGAAADRIRVSQAVKPALPVRVLQASLDQVKGKMNVPVEMPKGALPGRGGLRVEFSPSLAGSLSGVADYMADYPWNCAEQRASRAVALGDRAAWNALMDALPGHLDRDGLARFFPSPWLDGDEILSAYLLALADASGWGMPEAPRARLAGGLRAWLDGQIRRAPALPTADLAIRKVMVLEALARHGQAQAADLDPIAAEPNLWPTHAVVDWLSLLRRLPGARDRDQRLAEAQAILRGRFHTEGTVMKLSTGRRDFLPWLMVSPDLAALKALALVAGDPAWRADLPRLARGALQRQQRGHWDLTPANAWGVLAFGAFSARYESTPVKGATRASLGKATAGRDWSAPAPESAPVLPWTEKRATLSISHQGDGAPWALVSSLAALPLDAPVQAGFKVERSITPVDQKRPGRWSRGDVARVRLTVEAQAESTWVVVEDPLPGGATLLGSGLGRDSAILAAGARAEGARPAFEERRADVYRAYYRFVPKGGFSVEYTVRLNAEGRFQLPPARVEAMYSPEMHADLPLPAWEVGPP